MAPIPQIAMELTKKKTLLCFLSFIFSNILIIPTISVPVPGEVSKVNETCNDEICKQWKEINSAIIEEKNTLGKNQSETTNFTVVLDTSILPTTSVPMPDETSILNQTCNEEICKQWEEIDSVNVEDKFTVKKYRSKISRA